MYQELKYRNRTYSIETENALPLTTTPTDLAFAAEHCKVQVMTGNRDHSHGWRTMKNGPTKHRVLTAAIKTRIDESRLA